MTNLVAFQFESQSITVITDEHGEVWFSANEVCGALGYSNPRDAIANHVDDEDVAKRDTLTPGGRQQQNHVNESGLYALIFGSTKDEAKRFKRWVTHDVLPAIRKTGGYTAPEAQAEAPSAITATKEFRALYGIARLVGLDKNVAAISANQAVTKITGTNVLQLLGHTHLEAERQQLVFTPTELGERLGVSGREFNMLLAEAGLQAKKGEHWAPLAAAEGFCRVLDTGKRHGDGVMIQQLKWAENVLSLVQHAA
jgi:prophage antirepressor-like protein